MPSTRCIYARISIQVTVDHAEHQGDVGAWGVTKSSQCFGKVLSVLIFVDMIVGGGSYV